MPVKDNKDTYFQLRKQFPVFTYRKYNYSISDHALMISFVFDLSGKFTFQPKLQFKIERQNGVLPAKEILDNLVFHIGMIELISYWKLACPPLLIIEPFNLNTEQIKFWKKLYFNGLGEFFYMNSIDAEVANFMNIQSRSMLSFKHFDFEPDSEKILVPVGGGKDSNVSLNLLRDPFDLIPFIVNPRGASLESAKVAGFKAGQIFKVNRQLDPLLISLNSQGFLNGHTPFSALLGFVSLLAALLSNARYIALSNESSANEPTVKNGPNHQYSKSFEFEKDFREYVDQYITSKIEYFSFLRPLSELQIARLFAQSPAYFPVFKSCNAGSKTDSWCGHCPKCLFTFIILSPFIANEKLIRIFGHNLFEDISLIPVLEELSGIRDVKPFECVGTINEVKLALSMVIEKHPKPLPPLLKHFMNSGNRIKNADDIVNDQFPQLDASHFIPPQFFKILKQALHVF